MADEFGCIVSGCAACTVQRRLLTRQWIDGTEVIYHLCFVPGSDLYHRQQISDSAAEWLQSGGKIRLLTLLSGTYTIDKKKGGFFSQGAATVVAGVVDIVQLCKFTRQQREVAELVSTISASRSLARAGSVNGLGPRRNFVVPFPVLKFVYTFLFRSPVVATG